MKKVYSLIFFVVLLLPLFYFNLGRFLDVTEKPVKLDLIVCLGGGGMERIKTSVDLFLQGYSKSDRLLLTGNEVSTLGKKRGKKDFRIEYIYKYGEEIKFDYIPSPNSTREEIKVIKMYMKKHALNSALIVTDPTHSRRVSLLTSLVSVKGDEKMIFLEIDSGVEWWDREHYYMNKTARRLAMREIVKIPYNFFAYTVENLQEIVKSFNNSQERI